MVTPLSRFLMTVLTLTLVAFFSANAYAGQRLNRVMKDKILRVGTPGDYRPFAILVDDVYKGHDIDVIEKITKELGVGIEYVAVPWGEIKKTYEKDMFDICIGGVTRTTARMIFGDFLPAYAPFGKVALIRSADKDRYTTLESLNQPSVHVIKNPGGTNEQFVETNLTKANVTTHEKNAEIPNLIAEGKGDVMITETNEAILYSKKDPRLYPAFLNAPLTPVNYMGFFIQKDDPDFTRVMNFTWDLLEKRGELKKSAQVWFQ